MPEDKDKEKKDKETVDYFVSLDNEEGNENADNLSITGRVNGIQVATVIRISNVNKQGSAKKQKLAKQLALIDAYLARQAAVSEAMGEKVTV